MNEIRAKMVTYSDNTLYHQTFSSGGNTYSVYMMHRFFHDNPRESDDAGFSRHSVSIRLLGIWCDYAIWQSYDGRVGWGIHDIVRAIRDARAGREVQVQGYNDEHYRAQIIAHMNASERADLRYPIIVTRNIFDGYIVIDGNHRIAKSILQDRRYVRAINIEDRDLMAKFKIGPESPRLREQLRSMTKKDFDDLYERRFR